MLNGASRSCVFTLLVVICVISISGKTNRISGQVLKIRSPKTVEVGPHEGLPEATEPCSAEECKWWKQIRRAANDLMKKKDEGSRMKFLHLLAEGHQKAYRVPLKDRPRQVLLYGRTRYPEEARKSRIEGIVGLSVEFEADGSIGPVEIVKRLGNWLDEETVRALFETVFLPAVRNGTFVSDRATIEHRFSLHRN